jgi:hypothetical protein
MNDEFDDLDRALFALPLETPPPGLRQSILRATIEAPVPEPPFTTFEIAAIGAALAIAVWLVIEVATNRAFSTGLAANAIALGRAFANPAFLVWLTVGAGIALWSTVAGNVPLRLPMRLGRP